MILVLDVGNSNIMLGVFKDSHLKYHWRIGTDQDMSEDQYAMIIQNLFNYEGISIKEIKGVIISSVVPQMMHVFELMCNRYFNVSPMIIGPGIKTGLNIKYENPREVGADRIVNAVAGIHLYGCPLIIVDFGTATSFCYINEAMQYLGGAIAPGIKISAEALYNRASKLPRIEITKVKSVIGRNTISAMQAGILYGYVGQVEGIVKRMKIQSNSDPTVIATGGFAPLIANESQVIDIVDPFLTLKGLQIIYEKNKEI